MTATQWLVEFWGCIHFFGIQIEKGLFVDLPPLLMVVCYSRKRVLVGDAHGQLAGETMATPLLLDGFMENPKNG